MSETMLERLVAAHANDEAKRAAVRRAQKALDAAKAAQEKASVALSDAIMEACGDPRHREDVRKFNEWKKAKR
jgi:hypothetical protein